MSGDVTATKKSGIYEKPKYLEPIDTETRNKIVTVSSKVTTEIPGCVIVGGAALRLLYEVKTGNPMFGAGKGDYDIYVPTSQVKEIEQEPPLGYQVNQEPCFHKPEQGYIVLIDEQNNAHIDVFGRGEREFEDVVLEGKTIRVLSLGEQVADRLRLFVEDFKKLKPGDQDKHRFYIRKLQEIIEVVGNDEQISHTWDKAIERRKVELTRQFEEYKSLAEGVGLTLEEFARQNLSAEAAKPNADQTIVKLAEEISKIPEGDETFEEKVKAMYLSSRMKRYSSGWKNLLSQITGS